MMKIFGIIALTYMSSCYLFEKKDPKDGSVEQGGAGSVAPIQAPPGEGATAAPGGEAETGTDWQKYLDTFSTFEFLGVTLGAVEVIDTDSKGVVVRREKISYEGELPVVAVMLRYSGEITEVSSNKKFEYNELGHIKKFSSYRDEEAKVLKSIKEKVFDGSTQLIGTDNTYYDLKGNQERREKVSFERDNTAHTQVTTTLEFDASNQQIASLVETCQNEQISDDFQANSYDCRTTRSGEARGRKSFDYTTKVKQQFATFGGKEFETEYRRINPDHTFSFPDHLDPEFREAQYSEGELFVREEGGCQKGSENTYTCETTNYFTSDGEERKHEHETVVKKFTGYTKALFGSNFLMRSNTLPLETVKTTFFKSGKIEKPPLGL